MTNLLDRARQWWARLPKSQRTALAVGVPLVVLVVLFQRQRTAASGAAGGAGAGGSSTGSTGGLSGSAGFGGSTGGADPYGLTRDLTDQLLAVQESQQQAAAANEQAIVGGLNALEGAATQLQQQNAAQYEQLRQQLLAQQQQLAQQSTGGVSGSGSTTPTPTPTPTTTTYALRRLGSGETLGTYSTRLACAQAAASMDPNSNPPGSSMGCYSI